MIAIMYKDKYFLLMSTKF